MNPLHLEKSEKGEGDREGPPAAMRRTLRPPPWGDGLSPIRVVPVPGPDPGCGDGGSVRPRVSPTGGIRVAGVARTGYTQGHERRTTLARPEPEAAAADGHRRLRLALLHLPHDDQPQRDTTARPTEYRPCAARQPRRHRHAREPQARSLRLQCRSRRRLSHRPTPTDRNRNRIFSNGPRPGQTVKALSAIRRSHNHRQCPF